MDSCVEYNSSMKIAILGGGITGLTSAYTLASSGHTVILYEKSATLGGLAQGFQADGWEWPLEYAYHHIFSSDTDIIQFAKEIGFSGVFFKRPRTESLFGGPQNYRIYPVDSPQDFLRLPLLSWVTKIRASCVLGILKLFPMIPYYEKISMEKFIRRYMGNQMWTVFFEQLMRKKFGKYAGKVLASFLWARIHKRTQSLGYMQGGFQAFIDHLATACAENGVTIKNATPIASIRRKGNGYSIDGEEFDCVVSTLPSHILSKATKHILTPRELKSLDKLSYLDARVLILETDKPILSKAYWLNISTPTIPAMVIAQHTNFIDASHYGGKHIAYIGWYAIREDPIISEPTDELIERLLPHLHACDKADFTVKRSFSFVGQYAQPIFNTAFLKNKPTFRTSAPGFYCANLDMTYPYDRGTNYAVKLGKDVAKMIDKDYPNK